MTKRTAERKRAKGEVPSYAEACPDPRLRHRLRLVVQSAVRRCHNPEDKGYPYYGGRGIKVADEWVSDPRLFFAYLMTLPGHDDPDLVIDRIDNDGHYEPGNLRFSTRKESNDNRRPRSKWKARQSQLGTCPQGTKHRVMMARNNPDLPLLWPCDVARVLGLSVTFVRSHVRPCERHGDRMRWSWEQVEEYRARVTLAPAENTADASTAASPAPG